MRIPTHHRNTDLDSVLFQVERRPLHIPTEEAGAQTMRQIDRFEAIVDVETDYVFSVVSKDYHLITNERALELGALCFAEVFTESRIGNMELFNIVMPRTRSFCHVDYIQKEDTFEPWPGDKWSLFLRVTNSYNRTKLLRFSLGFCRWICTNGMIMGRQGISFRFQHTRSDIGDDVSFESTYGDLEKLKGKFVDRLHSLRSITIPPNMVLPLVLKVLEIRVGDKDFDKPKRSARLIRFHKQIRFLIDKYLGEVGENAYALTNIITEYANAPSLSISPAGSMDQIQQRCWEWVESDSVESWADELGVYRAGALKLEEYAIAEAGGRT